MYPMMGAMYAGFGGLFFAPMMGNVIFIVGVVILVAWAIKYLPAKDLKRVAFWCIGIGILLALLTVFLFAFRLPARPYGNDDRFPGMMQWFQSPETPQ